MPRITVEMTDSIGRFPTSEAVGKVRDLLIAMGVAEDYELHPSEIHAIVTYRERERAARKSAERLISRGPLPAHRCEVEAATGLVVAGVACPYGCSEGHPRIEVS
jgi:hypothetical protein